MPNKFGDPTEDELLAPERKKVNSFGDTVVEDAPNDIVLAEAPAIQPEGPGLLRTVRDVGAAIEKGFANAVTTTGQGLALAGRGLGIGGLQRAGEATREYGQGLEDWWASTMAPENAAPTTFGKKAIFTTAESLPSMVSAFIPAAGVNVGLRAVGLAAKASKGAKLAGAGAFILKNAAKAAGAIAEGSQAGWQNSAQVRDEINRMPAEQIAQHPRFQEELAKVDPNLPPDQRFAMARESLTQQAENEVMRKTIPWTGAISLLTGAGAIGVILEAPARKFMANLFKGMSREAIQEFFQSGGEYWFQESAAQEHYDQSRVPNASGVVENAVLGAVSGAVLGGMGGAAKGVEVKSSFAEAKKLGLSDENAWLLAQAPTPAIKLYKWGIDHKMNQGLALRLAVTESKEERDAIASTHFINRMIEAQNAIQQQTYIMALNAGLSNDEAFAAAMSEDPVGEVSKITGIKADEFASKIRERANDPDTMDAEERAARNDFDERRAAIEAEANRGTPRGSLRATARDIVVPGEGDVELDAKGRPVAQTQAIDELMAHINEPRVDTSHGAPRGRENFKRLVQELMKPTTENPNGRNRYLATKLASKMTVAERRAALIEIRSKEDPNFYIPTADVGKPVPESVEAEMKAQGLEVVIPNEAPAAAPAPEQGIAQQAAVQTEVDFGGAQAVQNAAGAVGGAGGTQAQAAAPEGATPGTAPVLTPVLTKDGKTVTRETIQADIEAGRSINRAAAAALGFKIPAGYRLVKGKTWEPIKAKQGGTTDASKVEGATPVGEQQGGKEGAGAAGGEGVGRVEPRPESAGAGGPAAAGAQAVAPKLRKFYDRGRTHGRMPRSSNMGPAFESILNTEGREASDAYQRGYDDVRRERAARKGKSNERQGQAEKTGAAGQPAAVEGQGWGIGAVGEGGESQRNDLPGEDVPRTGRQVPSYGTDAEDARRDVAASFKQTYDRLIESNDERVANEMTLDEKWADDPRFKKLAAIVRAMGLTPVPVRSEHFLAMYDGRSGNVLITREATTLTISHELYHGRYQSEGSAGGDAHTLAGMINVPKARFYLTMLPLAIDFSKYTDEQIAEEAVAFAIEDRMALKDLLKNPDDYMIAKGLMEKIEADTSKIGRSTTGPTYSPKDVARPDMDRDRGIVEFKVPIMAAWKVMSREVYTSNTMLGNIGAREVLQNSLDAVIAALQAKQIKTGLIEFKTEDGLTYSHGYTVTDNGIGMDDATVRDKFLALTETGKSAGEGRFGAKGVAKAVILMPTDNSKFEVWTQDNFFTDEDVYGRRPMRGKEWRQGTSIHVWDSEKTAILDGRAKTFWMLTEVPKNIELTWNGEKLVNPFKGKRSESYTGQSDDGKTSWNVQYYHNPPPGLKGRQIIRIADPKSGVKLTQGMSSIGAAGFNGSIIIDITTSYYPKEAGYPLAQNRETLRDNSPVYKIVNEVIAEKTVDTLSGGRGAERPPVYKPVTMDVTWRRGLAALANDKDYPVLIKTIEDLADEHPEIFPAQTLVLMPDEGQPAKRIIVTPPEKLFMKMESGYTGWHGGSTFHFKLLAFYEAVGKMFSTRITGKMNQVYAYIGWNNKVHPPIGSTITNAEYANGRSGLNVLNFPESAFESPAHLAFSMSHLLVHEMTHAEHRSHNEGFTSAEGVNSRKVGPLFQYVLRIAEAAMGTKAKDAGKRSSGANKTAGQKFSPKAQKEIWSENQIGREISNEERADDVRDQGYVRRGDQGRGVGAGREGRGALGLGTAGRAQLQPDNGQPVDQYRQGGALGRVGPRAVGQWKRGVRYSPKQALGLLSDWKRDPVKKGNLIGWRAERGNLVTTTGTEKVYNDGGTEGIGLYIAASKEMADSFGEEHVVRKSFPMPKNPIVLTSFYLLQEEPDIMEPPSPTDDAWLAAHKEAVKRSGVTDDTWSEKQGPLQRALTDVLLERGHDAVLVPDGKYGWLVILAKPGQVIRYSPKSVVTPEQDAAYMAAVEAGDTKTAQRMVDEAARAAGYTVRAWHGTTKQFNEFKSTAKATTGSMGGQHKLGFFFTADEAKAPEFAGKWNKGRWDATGGRVLSAWLKLDNPHTRTYGEVTLAAHSRGAKYIQDEERAKGHDGLILTHENYDYANSKYVKVKPDEIVVFEPSQIKSADAVTRDDQGNVIPLSERFNEKSNDIRYSPKQSGELRGEWWISDGQAQFADGDQGEMGHEQYAIQSVTGQLLDELGIENNGESILLSDYDSEIADAIGDEPDVVSWLKKNASPEIAKNAQEMVDVANGDGDAREYMARTAGWKRVAGNTVETHTMTDADLSDIASGLGDILSEEGIEDEDADNTTFDIYVASNQRWYRDVPYSAISAGSVSGLREYDETFRARFSPKQADMLRKMYDDGRKEENRHKALSRAGSLRKSNPEWAKAYMDGFERKPFTRPPAPATRPAAAAPKVAQAPAATTPPVAQASERINAIINSLAGIQSRLELLVSGGAYVSRGPVETIEDASAASPVANRPASWPDEVPVPAEKAFVASYPTNREMRIEPVLKKISDHLVDLSRGLPTFQGGKFSLAKRVGYNIFRLWKPEHRDAVTTIYDPFGGGGGWGVFSAGIFKNVKRVRVFEYVPDRVLKIKFLHTKGSEFHNLLYSSGLNDMFNSIVDKMYREEGTTSMSALASRIDAIKDKNPGKVDNDTWRGMVQYIVDYGIASFATKTFEGLPSSPNDAIDLLKDQAYGLHQAVLRLKLRGCVVTVEEADSYKLNIEKGKNVLVTFDPPYYNTAGYDKDGGKTRVDIDMYRKNVAMLERLFANDNNVIYTDEAWWLEGKSESRSEAEQKAIAAERPEALELFKRASALFSRFDMWKVKQRHETIGMRNAFETESDRVIGTAKFSPKDVVASFSTSMIPESNARFSPKAALSKLGQKKVMRVSVVNRDEVRAVLNAADGDYRKQVVPGLSRLPASIADAIRGVKYDEFELSQIALYGDAYIPTGLRGVASKVTTAYRPAVVMRDGTIIHGGMIHVDAIARHNVEYATSYGEDDVASTGGIAPDGNYYASSYIGDVATPDIRRAESDIRKHGRIRFSPKQATTGISGTFYSQLRRVLEQKMPNRATVQQVRGMIDPQKGSGVKADELKWSGLADFLDGKKPMELVTKEQVLEAARDVELKEVQLRDPTNEEIDAKTEEIYERLLSEEMDRLQENGAFDDLVDPDSVEVDIRREDPDDAESDWIGETIPPLNGYEDSDGVIRTSSSEEKVRKEVERVLEKARKYYDEERKVRANENISWDNAHREAVDELTSSNEQKFSDYTEPGYKEGTYREYVVTMPERNLVPLPISEESELPLRVALRHYELWYDDHVEAARKVVAKALTNMGKGPATHKRWVNALEEASKEISGIDLPDAEQIVRRAEQENNGAPSRDDFRSTHFQDIPGYLYHFRTNVRTVNGKKVLFVEEIQSDRAQKARKLRDEEVKRVAKEIAAKRQSEVVDTTGWKAEPTGDRRASDGLLEYNVSDAEGTIVYYELYASTPESAIRVAGLKQATTKRDQATPTSADLDEANKQVPKDFGFGNSRKQIEAKVRASLRFVPMTQEEMKEANSLREGLPPVQLKVFDEDGTYVGNAVGEKSYIEAEVDDRMRSLRRESVPPMPFADTSSGWAKQAMRRIIRLAAEQGADAVAWTTGGMQIDRYNEAMRQNVDKIEVDAVSQWKRGIPYKNANGSFVFKLADGTESAGADTRPIAVSQMDAYEKTLKPNHVSIVATKNGNEVFRAVVPLEGRTQIHGHDAALEDVIGKNIAEKVRANPGEKHVFTGSDLAIGGGGMKSFYDVMLVNIANDIGKKWGAKVDAGNVGVDKRSERDILDRMMEEEPPQDIGDDEGYLESLARIRGAMNEGKTFSEAIDQEGLYGDAEYANAIAEAVRKRQMNAPKPETLDPSVPRDPRPGKRDQIFERFEMAGDGRGLLGVHADGKKVRVAGVLGENPLTARQINAALVEKYNQLLSKWRNSANATSVPMLPITKTMRESVLKEGFPKFSAKAATGDAMRSLQDELAQVEKELADLKQMGVTLPENGVRLHEAIKRRIESLQGEKGKREIAASLEKVTKEVVKMRDEDIEFRQKLVDVLHQFGEGRDAQSVAEGRLSLRMTVDRIVSAASRNERQSLLSVKKEIVRLVNAKLPVERRGRAMSLLIRARTMKDVADAAVLVDREAELLQKKNLIAVIKRLSSKALDSKAVAIDYKERIEALLDDVLFTKPTAATIEKVEALREFIERESAAGREVEIPSKVLAKMRILTARPAIDMDVEQLEQMAETLGELIQLGRTKIKARENIDRSRKASDLEALKKDGVVRIESPDMIRGKLGEEPTFSERMTNRVRQAKAGLQRWYRMHVPMDVVFDIMSGNKHYKGAVSRIFKGRPDHAFAAYRSDLYPVEMRFKQIIEKHKIYKRESDRVGIYAIARQRTDDDPLYGRKKLYNTFGATTEEARKALDAEIDAIVLTPDEQAYYNFMRSEFDRIRAPLRKVVRDVFNVDLEEVSDYFPMQTDFDLVEPDPIEGWTFNKDDSTVLVKKLPETGLIKSRTGAGRQKVRIDSSRAFMKHMGDAFYLIHMMPETKYLSELARTAEFREMAGDEGQRLILEYVDTLARRGGVGGEHNMRLLDLLRRNVGVGTLGFRISSMLIQPSSLIDAFGMVGPRWGMRGANHIMSREWRSFILNNMQEVRDRVGDDPSFMEWGVTRLQQKATTAGYWVLEKLDRLTAAAVAAGAYERNLHERGLKVDLTKPDPEAIAYAQLMVRRTQASGAFKDVPMVISRGKMFNSRAIAKAFYQFQTFTMNKFSYLAHDAIGYAVQNKEFEKAFSMLLWAAIAFFMEEYIRANLKTGLNTLMGGREPEEENLAREVFLDFVNTIPMVGQAMNAMRYNSVPVPAINTVKTLGEGLRRATTGKTTETRVKGAITALGAGLTAYPGVPGAGQAAQLLRQRILSNEERLSDMITDSAKRLPKTASAGRIALEAQRTYNKARREGWLKPGTTAAEFRSRYKTRFKMLNES